MSTPEQKVKQQTNDTLMLKIFEAAKKKNEGFFQTLDLNEINTVGTNGMTALHFAVNQRNLDAVKFLVHHSAQVNLRDKSGRTPLFCATWDGSEEIVQFLLSVNADPTIADNSNLSPQGIAHFRGNLKIEGLLKGNIESRARSDSGDESPLFKTDLPTTNAQSASVLGFLPAPTLNRATPSDVESPEPRGFMSRLFSCCR